MIFSLLQVSWKKLNRTSQAFDMSSLKKNHRTQKTWQNLSENLGRNCVLNQSRNKAADNKNFFLKRKKSWQTQWKPYQCLPPLCSPSNLIGTFTADTTWMDLFIIICNRGETAFDWVVQSHAPKEKERRKKELFKNSLKIKKKKT